MLAEAANGDNPALGFALLKVVKLFAAACTAPDAVLATPIASPTVTTSC